MLPFAPLPDLIEVLYVEDQDVHVRLMQALFERRPQPVRLHVAGDVQAALALAPTLRPALLLLDLNLPDGHGVLLLSQLRLMKHLENVPAIAVTAEPEFDVAGSGFEELWRKPIRLLHVLERLDHWLPPRSAPPAAERGASALRRRAALLMP